MQFVLISRHTDGADVPENERAQNLEDMGKWVALLKPVMALPTRGERSPPRPGSRTTRATLAVLSMEQAAAQKTG
jgi:hypothetical protein